MVEQKDQETTNETSGPVTIARHSLGIVILLAILAGFFGGVASNAFLASRPEWGQTLSGNSNQTAAQKVVLQEDSAIIDVVQQASPSVVSVVISKDINQYQQQYSNPFSPSPFNFFGFGTGQQPSNNTPDIEQVGAGSGFFVTSDGMILTNRHVVADTSATYSVVTNDGKTYDAKILVRDTVNDLALIKIDIQGARPLTFADSDSIKIGQQVLAIGNSLGQYQNTVTSGIVSGIGRTLTAGGEGESEQLEGVIQTDAAINPGNSGGPLLNLAGQVIGINTAIDQEGQLVGFAIPARDAQKDVESYQKTGKLSHPFLGVRYVMLNDQIAKQQKTSRNQGALLLAGTQRGDTAVISGSPADKAGLKEGDIIIRVNGHDVNANNTLSKELKDYSVGDRLQLTIVRDGKEITATVTLEEAK
jgi:serine protease Do